MNNRYLLNMGILLALATAPMGAHATIRSAAMEACADALIEDLADQRGVEMAYRLQGGVTLDSLRRNVAGTYRLSVRDAEGGEVIARADCRVNSRAKVLEMEPVPLSVADTRVRAVE